MKTMTRQNLKHWQSTLVKEEQIEKDIALVEEEQIEKDIALLEIDEARIAALDRIIQQARMVARLAWTTGYAEAFVDLHAARAREKPVRFAERVVKYEVWQLEECCAVSDDLSDALHYCTMYEQDGPPVELRKIVSFTTTLDLAAMRSANGAEVES